MGGAYHHHDCQGQQEAEQTHGAISSSPVAMANLRNWTITQTRIETPPTPWKLPGINPSSIYNPQKQGLPEDIPSLPTIMTTAPQTTITFSKDTSSSNHVPQQQTIPEDKNLCQPDDKSRSGTKDKKRSRRKDKTRLQPDDDTTSKPEDKPCSRPTMEETPFAQKPGAICSSPIDIHYPENEDFHAGDRLVARGKCMGFSKCEHDLRINPSDHEGYWKSVDEYWKVRRPVPATKNPTAFRLGADGKWTSVSAPQKKIQVWVLPEQHDLAKLA